MMKNGVCKQEIKFDFSKIEGWHTNDTGSYKTGLDSLKSKPLKYNDSILSAQNTLTTKLICFSFMGKICSTKHRQISHKEIWNY